MTAVWDGKVRDAPPLPFGPPTGKREGYAVGESQPFLSAVARARNLARDRAPVILLEGEPGSGKTLFARGLHYLGRSPQDPFLALQCSSLPPVLLDAELYGAEPGELPGLELPKAGLLQLAGKGTVLLDEVQDLPLPLQARLGSHLKEPPASRPFRGRVVAACRHPLKAQPEGAMDPGLLDLLEAGRVQIPPLRKRDRDVELLARRFLAVWAHTRGVGTPKMDASAVEGLYAHPWPGNVRELRETVERAAAAAPGRTIRAEHLRIRPRLTQPLTTDAVPAAEMIVIPPDGKSWTRIEEEAVRATLELTGGNRSAAARILGVSRPTLSRKIRKYELDEALPS